MTLAEQARAIALEALRRVDVGLAVRKYVRCDGGSLMLGETSVKLAELDEVVVVAVGKAAAAMYAAVAAILDGRVAVRALVKNGAHPLPDVRSVAAAEAILAALGAVTSRSAVIFLVSGGASAMVEAPLDPAIPLADVRAFYQALIGSGLPIAAMNTLRKHLSAVKGGRLAEAAKKARVQYSVLVSDVPAGAPDTIGSGPSLADPSTLTDCVALLERVGLPATVEAFFRGPLCVETPKVQRGGFDVALSSEDLERAAVAAATEAGFFVAVDNACDEWEYRAAGRYLIERAIRLGRRCCVVSVGEVGVELAAVVGEGGRNQQFTLWCARELDRLGLQAAVLSAGSDGIDGNGAAAGAVCDGGTVSLIGRERVDSALERFDAGPVLREAGASIVTGPTGNNLRDLRLVMVDPRGF